MNGNQKVAIPPIGLGTSGRTGEEGFRAILAALEIGYRNIDTAQSYGSEQPIGRAITESGIAREELFLTTKVADTKLGRDLFMPSVRQSLEYLRTDYLDLLLIHWPSHKDVFPFREYIEDLAEAKRRRLTRMIGVSNFPIALVKQAEAILGPGEIVTDQVELHPFLQNRKLYEFATGRGIAITAYLPLARNKVADDPTIQRIAKAHQATPAQVTLAWLNGKGIIAIPASTKPENLRSNLAASKIKLTPPEVAEIDRLDRGERVINPAKSPAWD